MKNSFFKTKSLRRVDLPHINTKASDVFKGVTDLIHSCRQKRKQHFVVILVN